MYPHAAKTHVPYKWKRTVKISEILTESKSRNIICIDVQPEYSGMLDGSESSVFTDIIRFVTESNGRVLMFVNAEQDGLTSDTIDGVKMYWEDTVRELNNDYSEHDEEVSLIDWNRFTIIDKGYGYLRSWMDMDASPAAIIKTIRLMYQQKVNDSRELFGGEGSETYEASFAEFLGNEFSDFMLTDPLSVNWVSMALLKQFEGSYMVGGGRNECLREIELMMNAFNIKYKRINDLIYG